MGKEEKEHQRVCKYLQTFYNDVIFTSDASGVRMPIGLSVKFSKLKSDRGIPDILILKANKKYHGLLIEMKRTGEVVYRKDGQLRKNEHLKEQSDLHKRLEKGGYYADFAIGYDQAVAIIDAYMKDM